MGTLKFYEREEIKDLLAFLSLCANPKDEIAFRRIVNTEHAWIKSLSYKIGFTELKKLLYTTRKLNSEHERELANAVIDVTLRANKALLEELRGDEEMSGAFMELVEPWVQERERDAEIRGRQEGIQGTVDVLHSLGHSDEEIKTIIMGKYELSDKDAERYL